MAANNNVHFLLTFSRHDYKLPPTGEENGCLQDSLLLYYYIVILLTPVMWVSRTTTTKRRKKEKKKTLEVKQNISGLLSL